ncbi:MAG: serine/threonine protein kinase, partial [Planctomycetes bacterium]|nr:serine/threonine protein kinase [Planctomycetota bacterium]
MSRPYLCRCAQIIDVEDIVTGEEFECPHCETRRTLEPNDPALLGNFRQDEGRFNLLLERTLPKRGAFRAARPLRSPASKPRATPEKVGVAPGLPSSVSDTSTAPPPVSGDTTGGGAPGHRKSVPLTADLVTGQQLGPFRIEGVLGQGGMGVVFQAFDTSLQRAVALKVLNDVHARNEELVDRFRREARAAGALTHPNITHIYSIGEERGYHYFAMELVAGRTLSAMLDGGSPLDEDEALDFLMQIARGLRAAKQKKIIHRDIKPSNVLITQIDGKPIVKIIDFGLAKATGGQRLTDKSIYTQ